jgi:sigma-B regulation protein RsbU (phosphoserine phosphatase)
MLSSMTARQLSMFSTLAKRWQEIVGDELLLISPTGDLLVPANGSAPPATWGQLLQRASSTTPSFLNYSNQAIVTLPLLQGNQQLGYLLALNAGEQELPLLTWSAETLLARLDDEEAIQDMADELIGAWNQLELVYHVTRNLTLNANLMAMLKSIVEEIRKVVDTESGFILFQRSGALECVTTCSRIDQKLLSKTLWNNLVQSEHFVLCNDAPSCRFIWPDAPGHVENILATHLLIDAEDAIVVLGLINKADKNFTAGDSKLLMALASQVAMVIKVYLIHHKLIEDERLRRELEIAAEIQQSLLPTALPQMSGLSLAAASVPASEVGGDFYDFISLDDGWLTIVIGDVAGKGVPAAMLTSVTRTILRMEVMRGESPHAVIQQANNVLHQDLSLADSFATALVATINTDKGTLSYASAGHTPAILLRAQTGKAEQLKATSLPIGIFGYEASPTRTVDLNPGDTLVFYTDGVTEAQSPTGDLFGLHRLLKLIESKTSEDPDVLRDTIQTAIVDFCENSSSQDDVTLLIVKLLSRPELAGATELPALVLKTINFSYPADTEHLTDIAHQITSACRQLPALPLITGADDFICLVELAISEICTNIIKHAYADTQGYINGCITLLENGVQLDFYDNGDSFDPNAVPQPQSDPHELVEGGYGLHIVRQIMDVVSYEHHPERGNHWHLLKLLPSS